MKNRNIGTVVLSICLGNPSLIQYFAMPKIKIRKILSWFLAQITYLLYILNKLYILILTFLMYADFVLCRAFDDAKNISSVDLAVPDNLLDDALRYKLVLPDCFRFRKLITLYPGPL